MEQYKKLERDLNFYLANMLDDIDRNMRPDSPFRKNAEFIKGAADIHFGALRAIRNIADNANISDGEIFCKLYEEVWEGIKNLWSISEALTEAKAAKTIIEITTPVGVVEVMEWEAAETILKNFGELWTNDPTHLSGYAGGLDTGEALARWRILV